MLKIVYQLTAALAFVGSVACQSFDPAVAQQKGSFSRGFPAAEVRALRIASLAGDVTIRGGDIAQAQIVASTTGDCKVDATLRNGEIGVVLHGKQFWSPCQGTLTIDVPRKLAVDVSTGAGDLTIADVAGTLSLRTGSGDMHVDGHIVELVAKTGSGDMQLTGLHGPAIVSTGSGDVNLTYATLPEGTLRIAQGSGDVRVVVPHGPVLTDVTIGAGKIDNRVGEAEGARFAVRGVIASGHLSIAPAS